MKPGLKLIMGSALLISRVQWREGYENLYWAPDSCVPALETGYKGWIDCCVRDFRPCFSVMQGWHGTNLGRNALSGLWRHRVFFHPGARAPVTLENLTMSIMSSLSRSSVCDSCWFISVKSERRTTSCGERPLPCCRIRLALFFFPRPRVSTLTFDGNPFMPERGELALGKVDMCSRR